LRIWFNDYDIIGEVLTNGRAFPRNREEGVVYLRGILRAKILI
jgi:hypothetical protein